jgi:hypothetical protein
MKGVFISIAVVALAGAALADEYYVGERGVWGDFPFCGP